MSLGTLNLPAVFRASSELAAAAKEYRWKNPPPHSPEHTLTIEREEWHSILDQIKDAANRLKRALGATGKLDTSHIHDDGPAPAWPNSARGFSDLDYLFNIRIGLKRLAVAAMDLSGFTVVLDPPPELRRRGLLLLDKGLRQVWPALSAPERREVRPALPALRRVLRWTGKPSADPPKFAGPAVITDEEQRRVIDESGGFYTRDRNYLEAMQRAKELASQRAKAKSNQTPPPRPPTGPESGHGPGRGGIMNDDSKQDKAPAWVSRCAGALSCSSGLGTIRWGTDEFAFSDSQRACLKYMIESWEDGRREFTNQELLEAAGSTASYIRDVFRSNGKSIPAWNKLIIAVEGKRGTYGLAFPISDRKAQK